MQSLSGFVATTMLRSGLKIGAEEQNSLRIKASPMKGEKNPVLNENNKITCGPSSCRTPSAHLRLRWLGITQLGHRAEGDFAAICAYPRPSSFRTKRHESVKVEGIHR
jgi:hypothetical protein